MLKKYFSVASVATLAGSVAWISASTACGGDEVDSPADGGQADSSPVDSSAIDSAASADDSGASADGSGAFDSGAFDSGAFDSGASDGAADGGALDSGSADAGAADSGASDGGRPVVGTDPATVPGVKVTYGKCPAFTKCDGDLKGQWTVSGGCLPDTTFEPYKQFCAGLSVHDVTAKASGTIGIDTTNVSRDTSLFVDVQIDVDKANCAALTIAGGCAGFAALLKSGSSGSKFDVAACLDGAATCICAAQATIIEKTVDTYTVDGTGTLTSGGAVQRTFDYCPKGVNATYKETTPKNGTFGTFVDIKKN